MVRWKYTIRGNAGIITTKNFEYAEQKSRQGYIVFCKRENNGYRFNKMKQTDLI